LLQLRAQVIDLLLDLRHTSHLNIQLSVNVLDMAVDLGQESGAIRRRPVFADVAVHSSDATPPARPWISASPLRSGWPARSWWSLQSAARLCHTSYFRLDRRGGRSSLFAGTGTA